MRIKRWKKQLTGVDPRKVAQLVMMRIDQVNTKKDELTIAAKALADTAKQLSQRGQLRI